MRGSLRLALMFVFTLAAFLATAAAANASGWILGGGTAAQGVGEGLIVDIDDNTARTEPTARNRVLGAVGFIANAAPDCKVVHYHGTLFGKPDPAPGNCGWGSVFPFDRASEIYQDTASAITEETLALRRKSAKSALGDLGRASDRVDDMGDDVSSLRHDGKLSAEQASAMHGLVRRIVKLDKGATKLLKQARKAKGDKRKRLVRSAKRKLKAAIKLKIAFSDKIPGPLAVR